MTNIVDADGFSTRSLVHGSGGSNGGTVDDDPRRLDVLEHWSREDVSAMTATPPHLAANAEVKELKSDISAIVTRINR